jgi:hypothetical protein
VCLLLLEYHDSGWGLDEGRGGLCGDVYMNTRRRRELVLVEGAGSVEPAVANHHAFGIQYLAFVLVDDLAAPGGSPGDALG